MPGESTLALLQEHLNILRQQYAGRLPERLEEIVTSWQAIRNDASQITLLPSLHRAVHSLAGSGTTFGFPGVTTAARSLENCLRSIMDSGCAVSPEQEEQVNLFIADLWAVSQNREPQAGPLLFAPEGVLPATSDPIT